MQADNSTIGSNLAPVRKLIRRIELMRPSLWMWSCHKYWSQNPLPASRLFTKHVNYQTRKSRTLAIAISKWLIQENLKPSKMDPELEIPTTTVKIFNFHEFLEYRRNFVRRPAIDQHQMIFCKFNQNADWVKRRYYPNNKRSYFPDPFKFGGIL